MKKPSRKTQKAKCDKLWSEAIRKRNRGCCEICNKEANQPHHIIGRRNLVLRHDLRNGVLLCYKHHTFGTESAHQDPLWFQTWLIKHRREDYNYLMFKRMELKVDIDYEKVLKSLKGD